MVLVLYHLTPKKNWLKNKLLKGIKEFGYTNIF